MKVLFVFTFFWGSFALAAAPAGIHTGSPQPVLTDNPFLPKFEQKVVRNAGKIRVYSKGIGWIEDQNGETFRVSAREIKKGKPRKGATVTFVQQFKDNEWHAIDVNTN